MARLPLEYAVRNLGRSPMRLALAFGGATLVAALATAAAALLIGMDRSLSVSPSAGNVIVMGAGSEESLERSEIMASIASIIVASVPGIPTAAGVPLVSPEAVMAIPISVNDESATRVALLRGVEPVALLVHPGVRIIEGRFPESGLNQALVGVRAESQLGLDAGALAPGSTVTVDGIRFEIVGRFEAPGTVLEPEIWAPLTDVLTATQRSTISCVVVGLGDSGGANFGDLAALAARRLDLELAVMTEAEYMASLQRFFAPLRWIIVLAAGLVALGALLGGLNTLYAAFSSRSREVGTLQALGFSRAAVLISFAQESLLLSAGASVVAVLLCRTLLDGVGIAFSMGTFAFRVDAMAVTIGLLVGLGLAALGAAIPAAATLRRTIPQALRAP